VTDLDLVVSRTGHTRYIHLWDTRPEYRETIATLARKYRGEPEQVTQPEPKRPAVTIPPRNRDLTRQLVIAAYREDLAWLADVPYDVLVYHKGGACPQGVPCQPLPNTQREAGTILHHIVTRWDSLAPLTIFCQGQPFDHSDDFLARLDVFYDRPTSLTQRYQRDRPEAWIVARDQVETVGGFEVRYGDATIQAHEGIPRWFDERAWAYIFNCPMPEPLWFGYGATWAVPRASIHARPREVYAHLLSVCDSGTSGQSRTDPPINPWSCEALWLYIWSDPAEFPHHKRLEIVGRSAAQSLATACQHRACISCGKSRCALGKGRDGEVYLSDCVDCQLAGGPAA